MSVVDRATFRANPAYDLVLLDRLAPAERELLADAEGEGDLYGVLRPRPGSSLEPRTASSETALLFMTLAEPGPLPAYVVARLGDELDRTIARLVLDGVLELEHEGEYVCGARAADLLLGVRSAGGRGRIAELSVAALRYGQALGDLPEPLLAARLYLYGRRPVSAALRSRVADGAALDAYLGLAPGGSARAALEAGWQESPPSAEERAYWRHWRPRRTRGASEPGGVSYKLYVSPATDALETAIGAIASSLAGARGVAAFKVGSDLHGICRPDKLVVYFGRLEDLQEGAALLRDRLDGCPAHGVPFTAAVTQDGLLSWGADPPVRSSSNGAESGSWRMWVTERLAEYLTLARKTRGSGLEPWQFALERLRLAGIDTDTWIPASGMWPEAFASA
jgi:hypothetical protein